MIYCTSVNMCYLVDAAVKAVLPEEEHGRIAIITGKTPDEQRRDIIERFARSDIHCIINCMVLTEGYDGRNVDCIMNLRPTINPVLYTQIIGRGTRLCEGKEYCLIIDLVPERNTRRPLCTAPTLFGLEPSFLPDKTAQRLEGGDLLLSIEEIEAVLKDMEASYEVHEEMLDLFADELQGIAVNNAKNGFREVASAYSDYMERDEEDELFGDIIATRQPDEDEYYKIKISLSGGCVTLSKPDMLDRTVIKFSGSGDLRSFTSPLIAWDDAIKLVQDILYIQPEQYGYLFSRRTRAEWGKIPAT